MTISARINDIISNLKVIFLFKVCFHNYLYGQISPNLIPRILNYPQVLLFDVRLRYRYMSVLDNAVAL